MCRTLYSSTSLHPAPNNGVCFECKLVGTQVATIVLEYGIALDWHKKTDGCVPRDEERPAVWPSAGDLAKESIEIEVVGKWVVAAITEVGLLGRTHFDDAADGVCKGVSYA
jgi:hypothetical protein